MASRHGCGTGAQPQKRVKSEQLRISDADDILEYNKQENDDCKLNPPFSILLQHLQITCKADRGEKRRHKNILKRRIQFQDTHPGTISRQHQKRKDNAADYRIGNAKPLQTFDIFFHKPSYKKDNYRNRQRLYDIKLNNHIIFPLPHFPL